MFTKLDHVQLLKGGLFDKPFMQTRIKTHSMSFKEKLLGYFLGPAGMIVFYALMVNMRELYFTSVVPIDNLYGTGTYLAISIASSLVGVGFGVVFSWMLEHTNTIAGKIRPYLFLSSFLTLVTGGAQFCCPFAKGSTAMLVWLAVFNILYNGVALIMYSYRYQKIGLATRSLKDRERVTTVYNAADNLISGIIVGVLVANFLYYNVLASDMTGDKWRMVVLIVGVLSIPLIFIEYFYSRERVIEENQDTLKDKSGNLVSIPLKQQFRDLFRNKYFVLSLVILIAGKLATYMLGSNVLTNYCQMVLGANKENNLQVIYQGLSMAPRGFGILLLYPLVRKLGARKVVMGGALLTIVAGAVCMMNPTNVMIAFIGSFILNFGTLAMTYLQITFTQQANDIIEYEHGYRPEGCMLGSLITLLYPAFLSPVQGIYETVLMRLGYDAYNPVQNMSVIHWIVFAWFGSVVLKGIIDFICLIFFDAEKKYPTVAEELKERRKQAVLARGEEWIDEEELEKRRKEEAEVKAEEDRIKDLKERCEKHGLDFDTENAKYLKQKAEKDAKAAAKKARKAKKK